ncbi:MAG: aminotransferase class V-fold PLP-dependent enzyme [Pseudomonadota bacterium]
MVRSAIRENGHPITRRTFINSAAAASGAILTGLPISATAEDTSEDTAKNYAMDKRYWRKIARQYDIADDFVNLENGNWGLMARPVMEKYLQYTQMVNAYNSHYARRQYKDDFIAVREKLAEKLGVSPEEVAITRGATEALQALVGGYKNLQRGDAVMYADLDYGSVQASFDWLANKRSAEVVRLSIPEPTTFDGLIEFYEAALQANPKVKLLLLTHISNRTGLVAPVREIAERARARGVDVIVDAAHSWGQMDFTVDDLGVDFIGFNLHKWIGAPVGVGVLVIRKERLGDIATNLSSNTWEQDKISGRIHTGTANFAAVLAIKDALEFCDQVGWDRKEARLRMLRNVWAPEARRINGVEVLAPDDPRLHAGITSFRLTGKTSVEENKAIVETLLKDHGIFTVHRTGVAKGGCIRVTPALYNTPSDCERFLSALKTIA